LLKGEAKERRRDLRSEGNRLAAYSREGEMKEGKMKRAPEHVSADRT
jgi:hypothetical protein